MKTYLISLAVGMLVGVIYSLLNVRSPAPPVIALIGLLGILVGEQIPPLVKSLWLKDSLALSWRLHQLSHLSQLRRRTEGSPPEKPADQPHSSSTACSSVLSAPETGPSQNRVLQFRDPSRPLRARIPRQSGLALSA
jgi:XapX domain-containing protein